MDNGRRPTWTFRIPDPDGNGPATPFPCWPTTLATCVQWVAWDGRMRAKNCRSAMICHSGSHEKIETRQVEAMWIRIGSGNYVRGWHCVGGFASRIQIIQQRFARRTIADHRSILYRSFK